jgi:tRNA-specific 2-thiouridylase
MSEKPMVVAAMSGGVDSSVATALLVEQGYQVVGMMLRLWSEPGREQANRCCTPDAMAQARRVAQQLGIPFYAVDVRERFRATVVQTFLDGYARGDTPNPCWVCNRVIRWGALYEQARSVGAEYLATGHYARLRRNPDGSTSLLKGLDEQKDQSYVLSGLDQDRLTRTLFPIGDYHKPAVREMARHLGLQTADRPDSQDLCFLAGEDYRDFLTRSVPQVARPGVIVNRCGKVLGEHGGLAFYTIGQRKGLGIAAPAPLYVLEKRLVGNELVVGEAAELGQDSLVAGDVNWLEELPTSAPFTAMVKIRYKATPVEGQIHSLPDGRVRVQFNRPLRDITPGQRAVFYQEARCLGGGTILAS